MGYDFTADNPPHQPDANAQQLADWASEMFQRLENNLINQRDGWNIFPMRIESSRVSLNWPSQIKVADNGAGSTGVYAFAFTPSIENELIVVGHVPLSADVGSNVYIRVIWSPSDATAGNVVWGFESTHCKAADPACPGLPTAFGNTTILNVTAPTNSTDRQLLITQFDLGVEIPFNTLNELTIVGRVFRDHDHASDTYANDALFYGAQVYVCNSKMGNDELIPSSLLVPGLTILSR